LRSISQSTGFADRVVIQSNMQSTWQRTNQARSPILIRKNEEKAIAQCITQLPERQRAALALFHFEGLSGRDAAAMEMTEKGFESLLTRFRAW
jgi:DNA-directed RNA polymerase specialized sigma24 family protein